MLTHLILRDFKSYHDCSVPLGPLTLIVGTNASGKSNLRDALRVLQGIGLGLTVAELIGDKYGPGGVKQWRGIRGGSAELVYHGAKSCSVTAIGNASKGRLTSVFRRLRYQVTIDPAFGKKRVPRIVNESLYQYRSVHFDSHSPTDPVEQKGAHSIHVRYRRGGNYRKHGRAMEFSSASPVLTQILETDAPQTARRAAESMIAEFQSIRFLDLDPEAMREASQPGQLILGDRGENLSSVLQGICDDEKQRDVLLSWVKALTPMDAVDFEFPVDFSGRVLVHLVESNGNKVSAFSASDGTLRFLAMIAALLSPDTGRIYFFEEFDNGIHPTRLHLLLQLVQQACKEQSVQVIGTTHNPALLSYLDESARNAALLVYRGDGSAESKVRRISDLPDVAEILKTQDLGKLHSTGWLEDAAAFSDPDGEVDE